MKQLEIDSEIHQWFAAHDRMLNAALELTDARFQLDRVTELVAKRLLPSDAKPGEIYIFPCTDGKAVRAFLKHSVEYPVGAQDTMEVHVHKACVQEHDFNRK